MKATIERATLLKGLGHVHSVVERRNTIPILSNVLIEAEEQGGLRLMATDLDLQINETVEAEVGEAGATTVPAHTLFDIVRKMPEGSQVELIAAEGRMQVNAGRARFTLSTLPRDDFPVIAEGDLPTAFELPAATLKQIIDKTRFAISTEETRYYLNGIYLHVSDGEPLGGGVNQPVLKAAATDGHRLARVTVPRPDGASGMPGVIIPRKCVAELRKLLDELDGTVQVSLSESKIRFGLGNAVLTSKLIDGTFPDYSRVIPTANDKIASRRSRASALARSRCRWTGTASPCRSPRPKTAPPRRRFPPITAPTASRSASTPAICSTYWARSKATSWRSISPTPPRRPCCVRMTRRRRSTC
jgi:DNA polymerase-3 subunit beta